MPPTLIQIPFSPWSEKARWALDHHRIGYRSVDHVPMVAEPLLRALARDLRRPATVPVLIDGKTVLSDSFAIARWADERGSGTRLVPEELEGAIVRWDARAEAMMRAARARLMHRLIADDAALLESVPPPLDRLGRAMLPVARSAARFVADKHGATSVPPAEAEAAISAGMDAALRALEAAGPAADARRYLVGGRFTQADLSLACALQFVSPPARLGMSDASRRVWSEPALAAAYPELLAWRDRLIEDHR